MRDLEPPETDATPIRDAACVVVVDDDGSAPRLLLGRRHADQIFLPDKWVFPGGRVDPDDRAYAAATDTAGSEGLRSFAYAAVRELYEETGLVIGDAGGRSVAGLEGWRAFAAAGFAPAIGHLEPLARAITPPGRPRRYDTWFFLARRRRIAAERAETDGELLDPGWFTVAECRRLDLPNITRLILDDVARHLENPEPRTSRGIPFYFQDSSGFQRTLIEPGCGGPWP